MEQELLGLIKKRSRISYQCIVGQKSSTQQRAHRISSGLECCTLSSEQSFDRLHKYAQLDIIALENMCVKRDAVRGPLNLKCIH